MENNEYMVYNRCKYDIGVELVNGQRRVVEAGNFQVMSAQDIMYTENKCRVNKFFAKKMLVPVDANGNDVPLSAFNYTKPSKLAEHLSDKDIEIALKMSNKKMEEWLGSVTDPAELHAIYLVAKDMDSLPKSKLAILQNKMPDKDWFAPVEEE